MKRNRVVWFFVVFVATCLLIEACAIGVGDPVSQERGLTGFEGIVTDCSGDVKVHPGRGCKVIVTTESNIQDYIVTEVRGNILYIDSKKAFSTKKLTIDVYIPELKAIAIKGSGDMKVNSGTASGLVINLSDSGNLDARNYQVENINITVTEDGNARIWATETLTANLSGSGDVFYKGNPKTNLKVTGSGNVRTF